jgi:hypothetical protein
MVDIQQRLREIRVACDLGPLNDKNLERYWVDTDSARDPYQSVRESIRLRLEDKKDVRLLFYGHGGCGKSTELAKLVQELGQRYYVVFLLRKCGDEPYGRDRRRPDTRPHGATRRCRSI